MTKLSMMSAALAVAAACQLNAAVLYSPTQIGSSARISDYGSATQSGFQSFDNFSVTSGGAVEKVTWTGFWIDLNNPLPAASPSPDALSWDIAFYGDNVGTPGSQLFLESFSAASVSSTFLGTGVFSAGGSYNVSFYEYSIDLAAAFPVLPTTQYWVSALSRSESYLPAFALEAPLAVMIVPISTSSRAALSIVDAALVARDRAFVLEGTVVPEPGTLLVGAAGLLALPLLRRRERGANSSHAEANWSR